MHERHIRDLPCSSRVSILVFVELALDDLKTNDAILGGVSFQSLFSWNLLLMRDYTPLSVLTALFQSLFSWNLLLMTGIRK